MRVMVFGGMPAVLLMVSVSVSVVVPFCPLGVMMTRSPIVPCGVSVASAGLPMLQVKLEKSKGGKSVMADADDGILELIVKASGSLIPNNFSTVRLRYIAGS